MALARKRSCRTRIETGVDDQDITSRAPVTRLRSSDDVTATVAPVRGTRCERESPSDASVVWSAVNCVVPSGCVIGRMERLYDGVVPVRESCGSERAAYD